jgi:hypothetical protein
MDSLELGKANLDIMAETLLALAQNDKRILVVTGLFSDFSFPGTD